MDFELPSPKRARIDINTGPQQPSAEPSNPGTPFDDVDDLYSTPPALPQSSGKDRSEDENESETSKPLEAKRTFQLPGLGQSAHEQQDETATSIVDSREAIEAKSAVEILREEPDNVYGPQASRDGQDDEINAGLGTRSGPSRAERRDTPLDNSDIDAYITINEPSTFTPFDATPGLNEGPMEQLMASQTENATEANQGSSFSNTRTETDIASLSKELLPAAVDDGQSTEAQSGHQPSANGVCGPGDPMEVTATLEDQPMAQSEARPNQASDGTVNAQTMAQQDSIFKDVPEANKPNEDAEFEMDSSPIESSSSDSLSETSSSDDSDDYELLSPEEQARRLMQEDGGSEDEGTGKNGNGTLSGPLRTTNEKPDEVVPKPDLTVSPEMRIQELGDVEALVENLALIKAKTSGEYQVLETGSVLCLGDRSVIGVVAETLGRVQQPYYSVRFTNAAAIAEAGLSKGTQIFYVEQHSNTVFTQPLKAYKGSDASNLHDEEVGDDEMEFSDDEKEAEHKRGLKQAKQARRGERPANGDGFSKGPGRGGNSRGRPRHRGGRPDREPMSNHASGAISYDDVDVDGPYNPLARPSNLHEMMGRSEAPMETHVNGNSTYRGGREGCGAGDRGRGRGRGRGDRGRGNRDGSASHRSHDGYGSSTARKPVAPFWNDTSQTQHSPTYGYPHQQSMYLPAQYSPQQDYISNFSTMRTQPNASPLSYPSYQHQSPTLLSHQNFHNQAPQSGIPPGAFVNPAFFSQSPQGDEYAAGNTFSPK